MSQDTTPPSDEQLRRLAAEIERLMLRAPDTKEHRGEPCPCVFAQQLEPECPHHGDPRLLTRGTTSSEGGGEA